MNPIKKNKRNDDDDDDFDSDKISIDKVLSQVEGKRPPVRSLVYPKLR